MAKHGINERYLKNLFPIGSKFQFAGINYTVLDSGKPCPPNGECKTDIYVLAETDTKQQKEFKISFKQNDADFLENKIKLERAIEILGKDAQEIIKAATMSIKKSFEDDYMVYFRSHKRTDAKCLKMGWKFEFLNKAGGEKSGKIPLTKKQKIDIYAGTNLPIEKRDSYVNGKVIKDSGIANYIIEADRYDMSLDYYLKKMVEIEPFAEKQEIYFACKALNYRCEKEKWDGDRPLAVYVDWKILNDKLVCELVFDNPLSIKGNAIGENISNVLKQLKITKSNFNNLKSLLDGNVKSF